MSSFLPFLPSVFTKDSLCLYLLHPSPCLSFPDLVQSEQARQLRCLVSVSLLVALWHPAFFDTPDCNQHLLRDLSSSSYPLVKKNSGRPWVYLYMKHCLEHNVGEWRHDCNSGGETDEEIHTFKRLKHKLGSCCGWEMSPGSYLCKFSPCCI